MKLKFIALDRLAVSNANMRHGRKAPDVSDILPTVRKRGVLQPILVRQSAEPGMFEIVAGRRRYHAAKLVAAERDAARSAGRSTGCDPVAARSCPDSETEATASIVDAPEVAGIERADLPSSDIDPSTHELPCAVLDEADDASAIEASLIENIARLDPDEVARWECFTRLVREGRSPEQIGQTFGLPDLAVRRVLALGNLLPRIRDLYRREEIDALTVRHLTLASKSQQKAWLALVDDADAWVPRGHQLKNWLFGGQSIPVSHALFDVETCGLAVIADLFGNAPLFAEPEGFWALQNAAIEARREQYIEAGWPDAIVIAAGEHFHSWEYEKAAKRKGGRVYIDVRADGEVVFHEGYLTRKEAARLARASEVKASGDTSGEGAATGRPELTSVSRNYIDLHRHAAVRAALLDSPGIALRLLAAHVLCGSSLWRVSAEPQATKNEAVHVSVVECRGEAVFDARRRAVLALLGCDREDATVVGGTGWASPDRDLEAIFARLLTLSDPDVLEVLAVVMGETLAVGSRAVEIAGIEIGLSMSDWWEADDAFFEGLRDREVLLAILAEVAGSDIAKANDREKGRALKTIIRDHLAGNNGRVRRGNWVPRWMAFPPADYTARGVYAAELAREVSRSHAGDGDDDSDVQDDDHGGEHPGTGQAPDCDSANDRGEGTAQDETGDETDPPGFSGSGDGESCALADQSDPGDGTDAQGDAGVAASVNTPDDPRLAA